MPRLVEDDDGAALVQAVELSHDAIGLFGHTLVQVLTGLVVLVNLPGLLQSEGEIFLRQQIDSLFAILYASRGVDAWTDFEDDIAYGNLFVRETADVNDGFQTYAGVAVYLFQSMIGQDTVFAHDGYNV